MSAPFTMLAFHESTMLNHGIQLIHWELHFPREIWGCCYVDIWLSERTYALHVDSVEFSSCP